MSGGKYFSLVVILALNLFSIIVFGLRANYLGELLIFVLMTIASLMILRCLYKNEKCGLFTALFFIISLINIFYIKNAFEADPLVNLGLKGLVLFGLNMLLNAAGFLIGISCIERNISHREKDRIIEKDIEPKIKEMEEKLEKETKDYKTEPWPSVAAAYYPGKFIASSNSTYYHAPKCDWAKKINEKRRVWFSSKEEARKKGYKMHSCLKK
jgi:hypothetical protein